MISTQEVGTSLHLALHSLQHRGQDAAGIATLDRGRFHLIRGLGMIAQAIPVDEVQGLRGYAGIAHVRYPTAGRISTRDDAQPFLTRRPGCLLAHNGNVTNVPELKDDLREQGLHVLSECDAEPILLVLADELTRLRPSHHTSEDLRTAVAAVFRRVRGAYSVVAVLEIDGEQTLIAFRDPHGIRPGVYGRRGGDWLVASESVALDVLGYSKVGDIPPGGVLLMRPDREIVQLEVTPPKPKPCAFERIYFARADSVMEDGRVNRSRWLLGRVLAREWKARGHQADVVTAVPDTSRPAAMAIAEELGIRHREGFIKNRYSGRTFIMPDQASRNAALRLKLNPIRETFEGQRVLVVDDSIVRGNTMRRLLALLRTLGPKEIHVGIISPGVRNPCFYGIDMPTQDELLAAQWSPEDMESAMARDLGADSVTFLSMDGLHEVLGSNICDACFSGNYSVPVSDREREAITSERRG